MVRAMGFASLLGIGNILVLGMNCQPGMEVRYVRVWKGVGNE